jgi:hypothetical protein
MELRMPSRPAFVLVNHGRARPVTQVRGRCMSARRDVALQ